MTEKPKRTEEEILFHDGVKVILGGKEYVVKPLAIRPDREWRQKLAKLVATLPQHTNVTTDKPKEFGGAVEALLVGNPDTVIELFFDYAKDLNRADFEETATAVEVSVAFLQVWDMFRPLPQTLTKAMTNISP